MSEGGTSADCSVSDRNMPRAAYIEPQEFDYEWVIRLAPCSSVPENSGANRCGTTLS